MLQVALSVLALLAAQAASQVTQIVTVGVEGSFFVPATVSARLGDTVMFVFAGDAHAVSQSSFEAPCTKIPGGFDSGVLGRGANFSKPTQFFSLTITNVSQPIWFFCELTRPTSHCNSGMVGVINPPNQTMYDQFVAAAKQASNTPIPTPSLVLSGVGAVATAAPSSAIIPGLSSIISSLSLTPSTLADTLPSSTALPSPSTSPSSHSSTNKGLIAGCAIAGILLILLLVGLAYYCGRRRQTSPREWSWRISGPPLAGQAPAAQEPMTEPYPKYHYAQNMSSANPLGHGSLSVLPGTPTMVSRGGTGYDSPSHAGTFASFEGHQQPLPPQRERDRDRKSPQPNIRPLPHVPSGGHLNSNPNPNTNNMTAAAAHGVDVNTLALEVASVLLSGKANSNTTARSQQPDVGSTSDGSSSRWYDGHDMTRATSVAPPYSRG